MGNGGFNPAYNFQIAVDTESRFIVGNYVTNRGSDYGELNVMFNKVKSKLKITPQQWLVDQGYLDHEDIIKTQKADCKVYVNPKKKKNTNNEDCELTEWRTRMGMDEAKEIYKDRASTSEWVNAGMRNRGLQRLLIRGVMGANSVLNLHVLTHNIQRAVKLGYSF